MTQNTHRATGPAVTPLGFRVLPRLAAAAAGLLTAAGLAGVGTVAAQADTPAVWDAVAKCESTNNWSINTGNGYYGGLQFSKSTWKAFGGTEYAATADKASKAQQIAVAQRVLASQGPGAWPSCSKKAGLTKQNGGANANAQPDGSSAAPAAPAPVPAPAAAPSTGGVQARLAVDGKLGPATSRAIEAWIGAPQNGYLSTSDIKALQTKVGAKADGVVGRETTAKLQAAIGAPQNGARNFRTDRATVRALQSHLNG
ncbi:transglycosylase family protein [Brachybacterium equifaecis]|uniref:transglycosylase family protein n=1 Tax=Brachybacterium equifaecis TaxID=2910770 RepID=UPI0024BF0A93|nr:transglycosylase family protein [Brachybacterium equifaecis]